MKILVLDEADSLLEDEFARELRVLSKCKEWPKVCAHVSALSSPHFLKLPHTHTQTE
jgi:hypothetical protein